MKRIILFVLFVFALAFVYGPVKADEIRYYKYAPEDVNWFYVFKHELPGPSSNKNTYYKVTVRPDGKIIRVQRFIRGDAPTYSTYEYDNQGRRITNTKYSSDDNKKQGSTIYKYNAKLVREEIALDKNGNTSIVYKITHNNGKHEAKKYIKGNFTGEGWSWTVDRNGLINSYIWFVSSRKKYVRRVDTDTGLLVNSKGIVNNKHNFDQVFTYDETGITISKADINSKGRKYAETNYKDGLRIKTLTFNYKGETYEVEEWQYNKQRDCVKYLLYREGKLAYYVDYDLDSSGRIIKSKIYDNGGDLLAEYYGKIQYLNRDSTPKDRVDAEGKIYKKKQLW